MALAEERGVRSPSKDGVVTIIKNRPTHQQLADMSGTTRETVSRVLAALEKKGSISVVGKDLVILDDLQMENL